MGSEDSCFLLGFVLILADLWGLLHGASVCFQALTALLSDDSKFGFIVIDGSGALFGTLQGNTREVLHKFTVDLPKKHGKMGGKLEPFTFCLVIYSVSENNLWFILNFQLKGW